MLDKVTNSNTEMLQEGQTTSPPPMRTGERAFEVAFFAAVLIAMAGWVYFITLLLLKLFLWFVG